MIVEYNTIISACHLPSFSDDKRYHIVYFFGGDRFARKMCSAKLLQPHRFLNVPGGSVYNDRNAGHPRLLFDLYKTFFARETRHAQVEKDEIRYVIAVIPQISQ